MTTNRVRRMMMALGALVAVVLLIDAPRVLAQATTALTGSMNLQVSLNQQAALDLGTTTFAFNRNYSTDWATGAGANQVNRLFTDQRTVAASSSEDLDLAGVLVDAAGQVLTFARVKGIIVRAAAGNTNNVVMKPDATAGFTGPFGAVAHQLSIPPGGTVALVAPTATGWVVTATTADLLEFGNSAGGSTVTYDVIIVGSST